MLYTLDEARTAFVRSALQILETVETSPARLTRLIAGQGSRRALAPHQRSTVYLHWALLADLEQAGHRGAIDDEIEGITALLHSQDLASACAVIGDQLPPLEVSQASALAA